MNCKRRSPLARAISFPSLRPRFTGTIVEVFCFHRRTRKLCAGERLRAAEEMSSIGFSRWSASLPWWTPIFRGGMGALPVDEKRIGTRTLSQAKSAKTDGRRTARKIREGNVGSALRSVYQQTINEEVPPEFLDLLGKLD